jgi:hypothetical protein
MSDQHEGVVTSLEELFLSREFGRAGSAAVVFDLSRIPVPEPRSSGRAVEGALSSAEGGPRLMLAPGYRRGGEATFEEVLHSALGAAPEATLASSRTFRASGIIPEAMLMTAGASAAVVPLREATRHRVIAAVSGIAAAGLVVAGVAAGTAHHGHPPDATAAGRVPSSPSTPSSPAGPVPRPAGASTTVPGALGSTGVALSGQLASESQPVVAVFSGPAASTPAPAQFALAPVGAPGATGGTPVGAAPPAPAPSAPARPLSQVVGSVGSAVTSTGTEITATGAQLVSNIPSAAPIASTVGGVGATVNALGQSLISTTI